MKIPKEGSHCLCVAVIVFNAVCKINKGMCIHVVLEECKYIMKEMKKTAIISKIFEKNSNFHVK